MSVGCATVQICQGALPSGAKARYERLAGDFLPRGVVSSKKKKKKRKKEECG